MLKIVNNYLDNHGKLQVNLNLVSTTVESIIWKIKYNIIRPIIKLSNKYIIKRTTARFIVNNKLGVNSQVLINKGKYGWYITKVLTPGELILPNYKWDKALVNFTKIPLPKYKDLFGAPSNLLVTEKTKIINKMKEYDNKTTEVYTTLNITPPDIFRICSVSSYPRIFADVIVGSCVPLDIYKYVKNANVKSEYFIEQIIYCCARGDKDSLELIKYYINDITIGRLFEYDLLQVTLMFDHKLDFIKYILADIPSLSNMEYTEDYYYNDYNNYKTPFDIAVDSDKLYTDVDYYVKVLELLLDKYPILPPHSIIRYYEKVGKLYYTNPKFNLVLLKYKFFNKIEDGVEITFQDLLLKFAFDSKLKYDNLYLYRDIIKRILFMLLKEDLEKPLIGELYGDNIEYFNQEFDNFIINYGDINDILKMYKKHKLKINNHILDKYFRGKKIKINLVVDILVGNPVVETLMYFVGLAKDYDLEYFVDRYFENKFLIKGSCEELEEILPIEKVYKYIEEADNYKRIMVKYVNMLREIIMSMK